MTVHSFDKAFRESKKVGPEFELYGDLYQMPASIPVGVALEVTRMQKLDEEAKAAKERGEEPSGEQVDVIALFDRAFGAAKQKNATEPKKPGYTDINGTYHPSSQVQHWIDIGLDIDQMLEMLSWMFGEYGKSTPVPTTAPTKKTPRGKA